MRYNFLGERTIKFKWFFVQALMLFKNCEYLIVLMFNSELLLNSMKLLVNSKKSFQYPSSEALKRRNCTRNRLQEPLCGPEISYRSSLGHLHLLIFFLYLIRSEHWRKSTSDREGSQYKNYDLAYKTTPHRICKGFI